MVRVVDIAFDYSRKGISTWKVITSRWLEGRAPVPDRTENVFFVNTGPGEPCPFFHGELLEEG